MHACQQVVYSDPGGFSCALEDRARTSSLLTTTLTAPGPPEVRCLVALLLVNFKALSFVIWCTSGSLRVLAASEKNL